MPTRQGGILLKKSMTCLRRNCRVMTTLPSLSTPCTWNTFLARSTPMVLTCMWTTPSGDSLFNDHPLAHSMPGAGVVHHINRLDPGIGRSLPVYPQLQACRYDPLTDAMGTKRKPYADFVPCTGGSIGTINVSPVATSVLPRCSFSATSSAFAKICFRP